MLSNYFKIMAQFSDIIIIINLTCIFFPSYPHLKPYYYVTEKRSKAEKIERNIVQKLFNEYYTN